MEGVVGVRRRFPSLPVGTSQQFEWLKGIIKVTLALNLLDAILTLMWVKLGLAREANVLLEHLVHQQEVLFVGVKIALVSLGMLLLWRLRHRPLAVVGVFVAFIAYYGLLLHHLRFAGQLMWYLILT